MIQQYYRQIKKRKRGDLVNQLMEHYKWRESNKKYVSTK